VQVERAGEVARVSWCAGCLVTSLQSSATEEQLLPPSASWRHRHTDTTSTSPESRNTRRSKERWGSTACP
jgi:hypothetical protein